jgi:hypothetical protein
MMKVKKHFKLLLFFLVVFISLHSVFSQEVLKTETGSELTSGAAAVGTRVVYGPFGLGYGSNFLRVDETQYFTESYTDVTVNVDGSSMLVVWAELSLYKKGSGWVSCGIHSGTSGSFYWSTVVPGEYMLQIHYIYPSTAGYCTYTIQ